jgi:hypothetical protein
VGAASVAPLSTAAVPIAAAVAPAAAARDLPERDGFVGAGVASAAPGSVSGGGAAFERDEVDFDVVAFGAAGLLGVATFGVVAFEVAGVPAGADFAVGATLVDADAFPAAGAFAVAVAFFPAGAFFSAGAFLSATAALEAVADLRLAFGPAAGSARVDPVDGVVNAVGAVASASLFAEAPFRGRLFDVIASWSPRARPCARTRARRVELRPVAALSVVGRARRVTRLKVPVGPRYVRTCRVAPHPAERISTIALLRLLGSPAMAHPLPVECPWP